MNAPSTRDPLKAPATRDVSLSVPVKPIHNPADRYAHFQIERHEDGSLFCIGSGGMGITYKARDLQLERVVALKVIHPRESQDAEVRSRFAKEARATARLQHPNIANVLYQGEEAGTCFYAMEFVAGETLQEYIRRVGPLGPVHALRIAHQVALALEAAAKEGILHRDLKPGNVMLTRYNEGTAPHVKVIDFGLAKLLSDAPSTFLTMGFVGTPEYSSPEQCEEKELDVRSDLYSLGATLWFMLTGTPLFSGSVVAVVKAHVLFPIPFEIIGEIPAPLRRLLSRLLAKDPAERPSTPHEAAEEIADAADELAADPVNFRPLRSLSPEQAAEVRKAAATRAQLASTRNANSGWGKLALGVVVIATAGVGAFFLGRTLHAPKPSPVVAGGGTRTVNVAGATSQQFTNSVGMTFVQLADLKAAVSVYETRVRDFEAYAKANATSGSDWRNPGFAQSPDDPVVNVSAQEAMAFCTWLTQKERAAKRISESQYYRLPNRLDWDIAAGSPPPDFRRNMESRREAEGDSHYLTVAFDGNDRALAQNNGGPPGRMGMPDDFPVPGQVNRPRGGLGPPPMGSDDFRQPPEDGMPMPYYWATFQWPPPPRTANLADASALAAKTVRSAIDGYDDGFAATSPVGKFAVGPNGLFDIVGNAWELCAEQPGATEHFVIQGGGWNTSSQTELRRHNAINFGADQRSPSVGFRCILANQESEEF